MENRFIDEKALIEPGVHSDEELEERTRGVLQFDQGEVFDLLFESYHMLNDGETLDGAEAALLNFLPYFPFQENVQLAPETLPTLKRALATYVQQHPVAKKNIKSVMVTFHTKNYKNYPPMAAPLHIGMAGRHNQDLPPGEDRAQRLKDYFTAINRVMELMYEGFVVNEKTFADDLKSLFENARKKRRTSDGKRTYQPGTINSYVTRYMSCYYDRARGKGKGVAPPGSSGGSSQDENLHLYFEDLSPEHPIRAAFLGDAARALLDEKAELDPKSKIRKNVKRTIRDWTKLDPLIGNTHPDVISIDSLAWLEAQMRDESFIEDPLTRHGFKVFYDFHIYLRRGAEFTEKLQVGPIEQLVDGPVLQGRRLYIAPDIFFGRHDTIMKKHKYEDFLSPEGREKWHSHFEGYKPVEPFNVVILPQVLLEDLVNYFAVFKELGIPIPESGRFLFRGSSKADLLPFTSRDFTSLLDLLSEDLRMVKVHHPPLNPSRLKRTFDGYHFDMGMRAPTYFAVTGRAKHAFEMPVRYSHSSSDIIQEEMLPMSDFLCKRIYSQENLWSLKKSKRDPQAAQFGTGSWHVIKDEYIPPLLAVLETFAFEPRGMPKTHKRHNRRTRKLIVEVPRKLGLRPFEPPRLTVDSYNPRLHTLTILGKGDRVRLLPLDPDLEKIIQSAVRSSRKAGVDHLLWLYDEEGEVNVLETSDLNDFFDQLCEKAGVPAIDLGAFRHNFRTALYILNVPDRICSYLLGHQRDWVSGYSSGNLTPEVWDHFLRVVAVITKNDKLGDE